MRLKFYTFYAQVKGSKDLTQTLNYFLKSSGFTNGLLVLHCGYTDCSVLLCKAVESTPDIARNELVIPFLREKLFCQI
ncbi:hypothetical protein B9Q13_00015 [Candidatus Marsarchaeota G2 archaeon ECH_B_SAG-G16]|uniref:Uncharacterized protein n=5 Tax=Candidatus Marsarchaeota TaxID=1978152 RepID=A0A2R6AH02_9ARCH|nr:MAG: hypothetical protein B9Q01_04025 [Candidatus Marsarchaeota G1 archaeon OSP_D]PSN85682.1 MAG: hypothetical protein B9Q02_05415 [Candidatus Marsarchaeota G1 archaeon BE_D]PSN88370.1 MAG: hypothetical protein B9Q00_05645 [Candidatus Marsarchaeota G1 archaeon OSP_C]PSN93355.1 MAG: hypothetical protein B9P99_02470 [Candidatus Marsarchaeota G1 archaeon OSP_B]PSO05969.1 MAG: hypothetical protein B9Q13_00015 [Candidatus Marsarchaeota G2 archaeon ECH_B_SAG-G16]